MDSEFLGVSPPRLSPEGGQVAGGTMITVRSGAPVYYTTDGSDPRLPDGGINPAALMLPADLGGAPVAGIGRSRPGRPRGYSVRGSRRMAASCSSCVCSPESTS